MAQRERWRAGRSGGRSVPSAPARWLLALVLSTAVGMAGAPGASASAGPVWPQASEFTVALPANAATSPDTPTAFFSSISCPRPGDCLAAGSYSSALGNPGLAVTETNGVWSQAQELAMPADGDVGQDAQVLGADCASPGNCTVSGTYTEQGGSPTSVMVVSETAGVWGLAEEIAQPNNENTGQYGLPPELDAVSCPTAENCVVSGSYQVNGGGPQAMVSTEAGGIWGQAQELSPLVVTAQALSCTSVGDCTAGGRSSDDDLPVVVAEAGGVWGQPQILTLPGGPADGFARQDAPVDALACTAPGDCSAGGQYHRYLPYYQPSTWVTTETNGVWAQAQEVALPANARVTTQAQDAEITTVSCTSPGNCVAGGNYLDTALNTDPMVVSETNGVWNQAQEVVLPPNEATSRPGGSVQSVSCSAPDVCTVIGGYTDSTPSAQTFVVTSEPPLSVTSTALPAATEGSPYHAQLSALGGSGAFRWARVAGSLPAGLTLSPSGVIAGVPRSAGSAHVTVAVSDPGPPAQTADLPLALRVNRSSSTVAATVGNQAIRLTIPPPLACTARGARLPVALHSSPIGHAGAAALHFASASFLIDGGQRHVGRGHVVVRVANATRRHLPIALTLSLAGLKAGLHTLTVVIDYRRSIRAHGHTVTSTVAKTVRVSFRVC